MTHRGPLPGRSTDVGGLCGSVHSWALRRSHAYRTTLVRRVRNQVLRLQPRAKAQCALEGRGLVIPAGASLGRGVGGDWAKVREPKARASAHNRLLKPPAAHDARLLRNPETLSSGPQPARPSTQQFTRHSNPNRCSLLCELDCLIASAGLCVSLYRSITLPRRSSPARSHLEKWQP